MADRQAGKRYAQAAFELARESGDVARWRTDLDDIAGLLAESELSPLLADSRVLVEQRLAMLDRVLDVQPLVMNLAKLLVTKGRSLDARAVAEAFSKMADESEGIGHAEVTTAVELTAQQLGAIERQLSTSLGQRIQAVGVVDPRILGGLVVRIGDRLVDGSVRTRLRQLRRELEGAR